MDIYIYMQGQRRGPYDEPQLKEMWTRGQLPKDALYWRDGMLQWAVVSDLFADTIMANITPAAASPDPKKADQGTTTPDQSYV